MSGSSAGMVVRFNQAGRVQERRAPLVQLSGGYLEVHQDGEWVPEVLYDQATGEWRRFVGDFVCEDLELAVGEAGCSFLNVQVRDNEDHVAHEQPLEGPLSLHPLYDVKAAQLRHTVWSDEGAHSEPLAYLDPQRGIWMTIADAWPEAEGKGGRLVFAAAAAAAAAVHELAPFAPPVRERLSPLAALEKLGARSQATFGP